MAGSSRSTSRWARRAARLHRPDPRPERDAWIAATALTSGLTVVTRNESDFTPMSVLVARGAQRQAPVSELTGALSTGVVELTGRSVKPQIAGRGSHPLIVSQSRSSTEASCLVAPSGRWRLAASELTASDAMSHASMTNTPDIRSGDPPAMRERNPRTACVSGSQLWTMPKKLGAVWTG